MIVPAILGEALFWSPLIVTGLLAIIVDAKWWSAFSTIYIFWVWLLPAIPIQLAFIAMFKFIINVLKSSKFCLYRD